MRQLVERDLARTLLALERDPARALELARPTTTAPGLTRGERTDAWLLVARAQRALGQPADAAIAAAEALQPYDRRELDALR